MGALGWAIWPGVCFWLGVARGFGFLPAPEAGIKIWTSAADRDAVFFL